MTHRLVQLSKTIAHALRHEPELYGLTLDAEGWVKVDDLIAGLKRKSQRWRDVTASDVLRVMENNEKPRYELREGKIRALHGHSVEQKIAQIPAEPPEFLYHGTSDRVVELILKDGLQPMNRQYVHLSVEPQMAETVGDRKQGQVIVLQILAQAAHAEGVIFYQSSEVVWLCDALPAQYLRVLKER